MYKKIISIILAAFLITGISICVYAEDIAQISVSNATVNSESPETVIAVSLKNNPGIVSAKMTIEFDSEALTLTKVSDQGILGAAYHSPSLDSPYNLYWNNGAATNNFTANGDLVKLTFKINENTKPGTYPIFISYDEDNILNSDMDSVFFDTIDGSITVKKSDSGKIPTISVGGISFDITLDADEYSGNIIAALYSKEGKLNDLKTYPATKDLKISFDKGKTGAYIKIMWWKNLSSMIPVCEAQTIPLQ